MPKSSGGGGSGGRSGRSGGGGGAVPSENLFRSTDRDAVPDLKTRMANREYNRQLEERATLRVHGVPGGTIEVTGNTYQHRDALKKAGFYWNGTEKMWYNGVSKSSHIAEILKLDPKAAFSNEFAKMKK